MRMILESKDGAKATGEVDPEMIAEAGVLLYKDRYYVYGGMSKGALRFVETTLINLHTVLTHDCADDFNNDITEPRADDSAMDAMTNGRFDQLGAGLVKEFVDHSGGPAKRDGYGRKVFDFPIAGNMEPAAERIYTEADVVKVYPHQIGLVHFTESLIGRRGVDVDTQERVKVLGFFVEPADRTYWVKARKESDGVIVNVSITKLFIL